MPKSISLGFLSLLLAGIALLSGNINREAFAFYLSVAGLVSGCAALFKDSSRWLAVSGIILSLIIPGFYLMFMIFGFPGSH